MKHTADGGTIPEAVDTPTSSLSTPAKRLYFGELYIHIPKLIRPNNILPLTTINLVHHIVIVDP